jgi:predicted SAM-dependent methyltransferase
MKKEINYGGFDKLEVGSGAKPKEGYLHFDIRDIEQTDVVGDARELPFDDESFNEVFSRFFLEHLLRKDAKKVLSEMYRVLKQGSKIEVIVPNLAYFARLYLEETGQKKEWALNKIYGFENYHEDHHFFGYDEETLKKYLEEAGFREAKRIESKEKEEQYLAMIAYKK